MWNIILFWVLNVLAPHEYSTERASPLYPLIVGGIDATEGMFPWMVALYFKGAFHCTATLISDRFVLTAGHCLVSENGTQRPEDYIGHAGSTNKSSPTLRIEFESFKLYPNYKYPVYKDVAIMITKEAVVFDTNLNRLCLSSEPEKREKYRKVIAMGWGLTSPKTGLSKDVLQLTSLKVVENSKCSTVEKTFRSSNLCVEGHLGRPCVGDSGGPLVAFNAGKKTFQVGIASHISGGSGCGKLSVYERVSHYKKFILQLSKTVDTKVCFMSR